MLQSILEFFRRLFGGKSSEVTEADVSGPQDGADMPGDSVEVVVEVEDPNDDPVDAAPGHDDLVLDVPHSPKYLWCLDNGHGKSTGGKRSPKFVDGSQLFEFELVREINRQIMNALEAKGVKFFNVVPEVDGDVELIERVRRANEKQSALPKIYLSIHANAFGSGGWTPAKGIETWYYETSANGRRIASAFQEKLIERTGFSDRGIRFHQPKTRAFFVLRNTSMAAVLTENGFYTNEEEARKLNSSEFRKRIADAHVEAIMEIENKGISGINIYQKNIAIKLS